MVYTGRFGQSEEYRREELIRVIEHSVENLTLQVIGLPLRSSKNSKHSIMI